MAEVTVIPTTLIEKSIAWAQSESSAQLFRPPTTAAPLGQAPASGSHLPVTPPIPTGVTPERFTENLAVTAPKPSKIDAKNFKGLGTKISLSNRPKSSTNSLNQSQGTTPTAKLHGPAMNVRDDDQGTPVFKQGNVIGFRSSMCSYVRHYPSDGEPYVSKQWAILPQGSKSGSFSASGGSSRVIFDDNGRISGLVTGTSGSADAADIAYVTPIEVLMERASSKIPDAHLGPVSSTASVGNSTAEAQNKLDAQPSDHLTTTTQSTTPPNQAPMSESEAQHYYHGLYSRPRLVARSSAFSEPWIEPTVPFEQLPCKELRPVGKHPIYEVWDDKLAPAVLDLLQTQRIDFTCIDILRIGIDEEWFAPVVLWIGVTPKSLSSVDGLTFALKCKQLLEERGIMDVHVELREAVVSLL
ncbi:unnamed protein product [Rhizoctonia solani]|uniref:Uncharacterized protein n=1 Tax=Rhizoctonia solani TaxID=456999 RepID=A0A8H3B8G5_9AGAM|nr:unnamed protein product [Rhizoctonia solani]